MTPLMSWLIFAGLVQAVCGLNVRRVHACDGDEDVKLVFDLNYTNPSEVDELLWIFYPPLGGVMQIASLMGDFRSVGDYTGRVTHPSSIGHDIYDIVISTAAMEDSGVYEVQARKIKEQVKTLDNVTLSVFDCVARSTAHVGDDSIRLTFGLFGVDPSAITELAWYFYPPYGESLSVASLKVGFQVAPSYQGRVAQASASGPDKADLLLSQPTASDTGLYDCVVKQKDERMWDTGFEELKVVNCTEPTKPPSERVTRPGKGRSYVESRSDSNPSPLGYRQSEAGPRCAPGLAAMVLQTIALAANLVTWAI